MIFYVVTADYSHTMETYLGSWGQAIADRVRVVPYAELVENDSLPTGTYVFSDIERLTPTELDVAASIYEQLSKSGVRLLNHPHRVMRRYELLHTLYEVGINKFKVGRASDKNGSYNYPVFLREEADHAGSLTKLLNSKAELDKALVPAMIRGHRMRDLMVVEYCNTADGSGVYRKYAAFMIGGRVVPCHIDCAANWLVKDTDIVTGDTMLEERDYLETNPHEEWIRKVFAHARIDYGRIDYGMVGDEPQVWEINTNPIVILDPSEYKGEHLEVKKMLAGKMQPAFEAIDSNASPEERVPITLDPELIKQLKVEWRKKSRHRAHRSFMRSLKKRQAFHVARRVLKPVVTRIAPIYAKISRVLTSDKR